MSRATFARLCCCLVALAVGTPAWSSEPLRVCLQSNDPPLSSRHGVEPAGFDVALARLIALRLDRPLDIQRFVTRDDADSNPVTEADALLSDQRCALLAGYPLIADKLGRPRAARGRLPPFDGATPDDRRRWVTLGELSATLPYRFDAITVALAPTQAATIVTSLHDLDDRRIGVVVHGLHDLIAMSYRDGELADRVVHVTQSEALFGQLENGALDAALVPLRELDGWRLAHPGTRIAGGQYSHSIGFNVGLVGMSTNEALLRRVDAVLADLLSDGSLPKLAQSASMTWLAPRPPDVRAGVTLGSLGGD